jgi:hypothetical protein
VPSYTGTVQFASSTDPLAVLPAAYTFTPTDGGLAYFAGGATFFTAGLQDLCVSDESGTLFGLAYFIVLP